MHDGSTPHDGSTRIIRRVVLATAVLGLCGAISAPAALAENSQRIVLDYSKGKCSKTTLLARSGVPTTLEITTSSNFTDDSNFDMPSAGRRAPLPDTYQPVTTKVDLGVPGPGVHRFKVTGSAWPGSVGTGCEGVLLIA
ncbi:hypothetical protein [Nocardia huaxiensis]|uniref:Uncharacterized protein n=1 Tax=Nocardia huaxiensis TaxID=2755382 RepID=A0A7D6ZPK9_9NOCA|nr:hypothetical protein [Nocardia huaxiensis]QLY30545.1 hypothetical protein H0264_36460 [Nocardia huaxiensis]UFS95853.1 hypothetical protein LPY97_35215 [Nocardia huaxiensis]